MSRLINKSELPFDSIGWEFQGRQYGSAVSFIIIEAQPGDGPRLHSHPYEEMFIVEEGEATFTIGDEMIVVTGGQVVVAPADVPHKFINSRSGVLRQVNVHVSPQMITTWLEEG
jgi:mannose-6-phosphate isomerase-like protein (cupin superfamily)